MEYKDYYKSLGLSRNAGQDGRGGNEAGEENGDLFHGEMSETRGLCRRD